MSVAVSVSMSASLAAGREAVAPTRAAEVAAVPVTATDSDTVTVPDQGPGLVALEVRRRPGGHGGTGPR